MTLGEKLKELRAERGVTQSDLAKMLDVDRSTYGKYETGDSTPDYEKLIKLAQYFNVSTDLLLNNITTQDEDLDEILEALHKRPEMKTLFSISRKATREDIETAMKIIEALKNKEEEE